MESWPASSVAPEGVNGFDIIDTFDTFSCIDHMGTIGGISRRKVRSCAVKKHGSCRYTFSCNGLFAAWRWILLGEDGLGYSILAMPVEGAMSTSCSQIELRDPQLVLQTNVCMNKHGWRLTTVTAEANK